MKVDNSKDYMHSFHWNYLVLELVDHIEMRLCKAAGEQGTEGNKDQWKYFKEFCEVRSLNKRVLKKMIEFSVDQALNSETELVNHKAFKALGRTDFSTANPGPKLTDAEMAQQYKDILGNIK